MEGFYVIDNPMLFSADFACKWRKKNRMQYPYLSYLCGVVLYVCCSQTLYSASP
jgi:hypothetical protein